jgi:hypothetical protein
MPAHNASTNLKAAGVGWGGSVTGNTYTQTYSTAARTVPNNTAATVAGTIPAGGTGATAGAYDSAVNRDTALTTVTEIKTTVNALLTDFTELKKVVTALIDDLQSADIIA